MKILWCEVHRCGNVSPEGFYQPPGACLFASEFGQDEPCRFVPMRLIPDDAETMWWCKSNRALRTSPGICTQRVIAHPQCCWVTIIEEPQWFQSSEQRPTATELTTTRESLAAALEATKGARSFNLTDGRKGQVIATAARERLAQLEALDGETP